MDLWSTGSLTGNVMGIVICQHTHQILHELNDLKETHSAQTNIRKKFSTCCLKEIILQFSNSLLVCMSSNVLMKSVKGALNEGE